MINKQTNKQTNTKGKSPVLVSTRRMQFTARRGSFINGKRDSPARTTSASDEIDQVRVQLGKCLRKLVNTYNMDQNQQEFKSRPLLSGM